MDWRDKRIDQRENFVPFYEQEAPRLQRKREFPNYLNPYRNDRTHSSQVNESEPPHAPAHTEREDHFDVTWKRPDKEAYYQQLRQELMDYQLYRSRQPFKVSSVPTIWKKDPAHEHTVSRSSNATYEPAIRQREKRQESPVQVAANQPPSEPVTAKKEKRGLNLNLSEIMAHERPVSGQPFLSHDDHAQRKKQPPYLKKETNGEGNKDE
ncbi:MAG: hypothetical protein Q4A67_06430 [Aerococcus sp.]|nr:hypothetical protein [Aerococcus sp.]